VIAVERLRVIEKQLFGEECLNLLTCGFTLVAYYYEIFEVSTLAQIKQFKLQKASHQFRKN